MTGWRAFLRVGVLASVGILLLPVGLARDGAFLAIGAAGVVAIHLGVRRHRPANRTAWYLLAAGGGTWVLGDALYSWNDHVIHTQAFPSVADVAYLAAYPLLAAGLLSLVRSRDPRRWSIALLDSTILTVGLALCSWVFLVAPLWAAGGEALVARLVGVAYPLGDVLLLAVLVRLATTPGAWNPASRLLMASFALLVLADTAFELSTLVPAIGEHVDTIDPIWTVAYVLWGVSALHPSMRALSEPVFEQVDATQVRRLVVIGFIAMIVPGVLLHERMEGTTQHTLAAIGAGVIMVLLVFVRMISLVRSLQDQAARLSRLADTDFVTGLANRRKFADGLGNHLAEHEDRHGAMLVLIDLERFTDINQSLGHRTGDLILRAVAERLSALAGRDGLVACMGGDTFGLLDSSVSGALEAETASAALREALEQPYALPDLTVSPEVSIGYLVGPDDCAELSLVLHRLDIALAAAKSRPGRIARYRSEMESGGPLGPLVRGELASAIERGELVLHYQPQVETSSGRVIGVEALVRWQHPTRGLLPPDSFISAAEQSGLIGPLTQYVLDRALAQCATWRGAGLDLTVAVNLSVRNLLDPGLVEDVRAALARHGLGAEALELEITESSAMVDPRRSTRVLGELADMGVMLSIDDYGTGHSSLAYLHRLPVRRLKIDRSFVAGILHDPASAAIVSSTIELARHLHLDVVAEGVEDDETLLSLRDMRCWAVQGFGIGRPIDASGVVALVGRIEQRLPEVLAPPPLPALVVPTPAPRAF